MPVRSAVPVKPVRASVPAREEDRAASRSERARADRERPVGVLYLVPTPIGNLEDITLRALRTLRQADWVAAEDTRRTRVLLQAHEIHGSIVSHHAHNEHREVPRLLRRLLNGESGALVTDAGMPGISDPGFLLAREARAHAIQVVVLPGPSAVITALVASGFPPEPFVFEGYLPATVERCRRALSVLKSEPRTVVFFEAPHRLRRTLELAVEILEDRPMAILREMTKVHEEAVRGTARELLERVALKPRGEVTLVLSPLDKGRRPKASRGPAGDMLGNPGDSSDTRDPPVEAPGQDPT